MSYKFSETEVGKLIQIGFIAAGETAKAKITAKANRKEWFAAENALEAALESFKANQVKTTVPTSVHDVEGATYIYPLQMKLIQKLQILIQVGARQVHRDLKK